MRALKKFTLSEVFSKASSGRARLLSTLRASCKMILPWPLMLSLKRKTSVASAYCALPSNAWRKATSCAAVWAEKLKTKKVSKLEKSLAIPVNFFSPGNESAVPCRADNAGFCKALFAVWLNVYTALYTSLLMRGKLACRKLV